VAELKERVLPEASDLLPGELVIGGELVDRDLGLVAADGDALDLGLRLVLVALELRELQVRRIELLLELHDLAARGRRLPGPVGEVVLVLVARSVEGGLQELRVLVGPVDLRIELLEVSVQLRERASVLADLVAALDELSAKLVALLAVRLLAGGLDRLH